MQHSQVLLSFKWKSSSHFLLQPSHWWLFIYQGWIEYFSFLLHNLLHLYTRFTRFVYFWTGGCTCVVCAHTWCLFLCSASVFGVSAESMQCSYDSKGNSVPTILLLMQERLYSQGGLKVLWDLHLICQNKHVNSVLSSYLDIKKHVLISSFGNSGFRQKEYFGLMPRTAKKNMWGINWTRELYLRILMFIVWLVWLRYKNACIGDFFE